MNGENNQMKVVTIDVSDKPSVRFTGNLEASLTDTIYRGTSSAKSWLKLDIYKTIGGNFICCSSNTFEQPGANDQVKVLKICETTDEVKEFFGHGDMAKRLYSAAGISDVIDVE